MQSSILGRCRWSIICLLLVSFEVRGAHIQIQSTPLHMFPADTEVDTVQSIRWLSGLHLTSQDRRFGGISGLEWYRGKLLAVSDRGFFIILHPRFRPDGVCRGVSSGEIYPLRSVSGGMLSGRTADAEELIAHPDGSLWVTFEHDHRLLRYRQTSGSRFDMSALRANELPSLPALSQSPDNGGIEAATWHPTYGLLAIREHELSSSSLHPTWIRSHTTAIQVQYQGTPPYRPTGMTCMANGDVVTVERHYSPESGPISRIVRIPRSAWNKPQTPVTGRELGRFEHAMTRDNFEAVVAAPLKNGGPAVLIASDDNYAAHQRTLLIHLALSP
ncbi:MAG: esterase-like activity of phytase family protein [Myxococcota bacterium]|nr:esterase-like activity of phytase family protein [Myxococcota bacterium]